MNDDELRKQAVVAIDWLLTRIQFGVNWPVAWQSDNPETLTMPRSGGKVPKTLGERIHSFRARLVAHGPIDRDGVLAELQRSLGRRDKTNESFDDAIAWALQLQSFDTFSAWDALENGNLALAWKFIADAEYIAGFIEACKTIASNPKLGGQSLQHVRAMKRRMSDSRLIKAAREIEKAEPNYEADQIAQRLAQDSTWGIAKATIKSRFKNYGIGKAGRKYAKNPVCDIPYQSTF